MVRPASRPLPAAACCAAGRASSRRYRDWLRTSRAWDALPGVLYRFAQPQVGALRDVSLGRLQPVRDPEDADVFVPDALTSTSTGDREPAANLTALGVLAEGSDWAAHLLRVHDPRGIDAVGLRLECRVAAELLELLDALTAGAIDAVALANAEDAARAEAWTVWAARAFRDALRQVHRVAVDAIPESELRDLFEATRHEVGEDWRDVDDELTIDIDRVARSASLASVFAIGGVAEDLIELDPDRPDQLAQLRRLHRAHRAGRAVWRSLENLRYRLHGYSAHGRAPRRPSLADVRYIATIDGDEARFALIEHGGWACRVDLRNGSPVWTQSPEGE